MTTVMRRSLYTAADHTAAGPVEQEGRGLQVAGDTHFAKSLPFHVSTRAAELHGKVWFRIGVGIALTLRPVLPRLRLVRYGFEDSPIVFWG